MQRIVTFKIDEDLLSVLDSYARKKRLTRSEVIREAIERLLKDEGIRLPEKRSLFKVNPRAPIIEVVV
ncbi:MAG: ribbon-helix-helix protein, CopG family [Thermoproteota archaeon]|jgi:metal-responsive CopG/Arc/MetJ family transcriptional regulator